MILESHSDSTNVILQVSPMDEVTHSVHFLSYAVQMCTLY